MASKFDWELVERVTVAGPVEGGPTRWRGVPAMARLQNGELLVAYREAPDHWITPGGAVRLARSSDGGKTWSEPETVLAEEGRNFGTALGMTQLEDRTVLLPVVENHTISGAPAYFQYYHRRATSSYVMLSNDGGESWSPPRILDLGAQVLWVNIYGEVLTARRGELMISVAWQLDSDTSWCRTGLVRSWDGGRSWSHVTEIAYGVDDEKSVCRLLSGRLITVMRDWDRPSKRSFSEDDGETWTPFDSLPFHGQSPSLLQTKSGVLLCAYRQRSPGKPQGVALSYSYDDGITWDDAAPLYVSSLRDSAYPDLQEISPGEYAAVYYTAAMGTKYLVPQDDGRDPSEVSPELLKYADPDNAIELVRFRER